MLSTKPLHLSIIALALCASATLALAQENSNEFSAVIACTNISEATERLACYDLAAGRLDVAQKNGEIVAVSKNEIEKVERDAFGFNIPSLPNLLGLGKPSENSVATAKKPKTTKNPLTSPVETPKQPGSEQAQSQKSVEIKESTAKSISPPSISKALERTQVKEVTLDISKTTEFGRGRTRFFLANGQVWEQSGNDKLRIPKARGGRLNKAEITKAAFGTFNLRVNGKGRAVKVKRVR